MLTWSKTSDEVKAYVNGTQVGSTQTGLGTWATNLGSAYTAIGAYGAGTNPWSGLINDVRIYDRALTTTEISDQYSASSDIQAYTTNNYPNKELLRKYSTQISIGTVAAEEVGPGPVAEWSFDEGQGQVVQDGTRNNNDGTLGANSGISTDDPVWQSEDMCVSGKCLKFDGVNDSVRVANTTTLQNASTFSVEAWVKATTPATCGNSFDSYITNNRFQMYRYDDGSSCQLVWRIVTSGGVRTVGYNANLQPNMWYHLVGIYEDTTNGTKLYINGQLIGQQTGNGAAVSMGTATLIGDVSPGFIDEVKIYPYSRSAAQVKSSYVQGASVLGANNDKAYLSDGLVGYWKMDEASWNNNCSTDTVLDSSGNNNHGDACPTTTGPTGGTAGKFGNGGTFDGVNDYVQTSSTTLYPFTNNFSISVWMNPSASINASLVSNTNLGGGNNGFQLGMQGLKPWFTTIGVKDYVTVGNYLTLNRWQLVTAVMEKDNSVSFYVDGQLKENITHTAPGLANTDDILQFGRYSGASYQYNGLMDEVRVYSKALMGTEVSDLYNWSPEPIGHWRMDDNVSGNAQTILDSSTSASNGTTDDGANNTGMNCTVEGKKVGACNFDGIDDYITVPSTNFSPSKSWTISTWVNGNTFALESGSSRVILAQQDGTGTGRGLLYVDATTSRATSFLGNTATYGLTALTTNTWNHISVVYNAATSQVTIFTNGQPGTPNTVTAEAASGSFIFGASKTLSVGRWDGEIDDMRVYNYAHTQTQVLSDMEGNVAGTSIGAVLPDPLAHYKFDEQSGQTVNNSGTSGSSLNGTLGAGGGAGVDDPAWKNKESCKTNGCLNFDGSNDLSDMGDLPFTESASQLTWSAWINPATITTNQCILCKFNNNGTETAWTIQTASSPANSLLISIDTTNTDGNTYARTAIDTVQIGAWQQVTLVFDGTQTGNANRAKVYINGIQQTLTFVGTIPSTTRATTSNVRLGSTSSGSRNYAGSMDEVKIYNTALTADQVKLDFNAGSSLNFGATSVSEASILTGGAGATANLEWNLDEKTGSTTKDISGNNLTGTINGASWTQGKEGAALRFDGTDDYVTLADNTSLNLTTITLEAWVKFNTVNGTNKTIVAKWQPGVKQQYVLQLDSDNKLAFWTGNGTTGGSRLASATTPVANTWYHVVATATGTTKNIYINGRLDATTAAGFALAGSSDIDFSLGSKKNNVGTYFEFLDGSIDKVKVYNYIRSQAQIAYNYNRGLPVAHYKLDECQGNVANDSSGNNLFGTINIGATGPQTILGTCTTSGSAWGNGAIGKFNSSLNFDATDDYVSVGSNPITGSSAFTLSGWLKLGYTLPYNNFGIAAFMGTALIDQSAYIGYVNTATVGTSNSLGGGFYGKNYGSGISDNNWHHVVLAFSGGTSGTASIYIDGVLKVSATVTPNLSSSSIYLGQANIAPLYSYNGSLDDVRIYNYELAPSQIKQVYNGGAVRFGPTTGSP
jgi:hypothetical protein